MTRVPREKMAKSTIFLEEELVDRWTDGQMDRWIDGIGNLGLNGDRGPFDGQLCLDQ